ncbi:ankyrin repeat domain-containing protein SOWAHA [Pholidichthys leucotaenia]
MDLKQESIVSLLVSEGGRVKRSDLVAKFKDSVDSADPAEKARKRDLFKTLVNNVAVVRDVDGVRYVALKKTYRHLLESERTVGEAENERRFLTGEQTEGSRVPSAEVGSAVSEPDPEVASGGARDPAESRSPVELALQRARWPSSRPKRMLNFHVQRPDTNGDKCAQSKPYGLPLRMPPVTQVETDRLKLDPGEDTKPDEFRSKRVRPPSLETGGGLGSPHLRRSDKSASKVTEEHKDTGRTPSAVPLEQLEHEWLVKCAAGHWRHVLGLLLKDNHLAGKRDFMSGFTALHWAAKCGNRDMLVKIMEVSRQGEAGVDVNAKTHGGYTPLHIAAQHEQECIIRILVRDYGADANVRDNCGKKAYHYLHAGISEGVREMLGEPRGQPAQDMEPHEKEDLDLFLDLHKGLHSISRLFQPSVPGHKRKHKQRRGLFSLSEDPSEEQEDDHSSFGDRTTSDVSFD